MPRQPHIEVGDITRLEVEAIVNAANTELACGGGVCGAIHAAAGPRLAIACRSAAPIDVGEACITAGFELPARYVIHAVGPHYVDGASGEPELLARAYQRSLEVARDAGLRSIAFPCISTGVFRYPVADAAKIALNILDRWLETLAEPREIICCCFTEADASIYRATRGASPFR